MRFLHCFESTNYKFLALVNGVLLNVKQKLNLHRNPFYNSFLNELLKDTQKGDKN